jgi:hypothetical protein
MRILKCALGHVVSSRSQYGVLAGLRVKLIHGLARTNERPTSVPTPRQEHICFMATRVRRRPVGN